MVTISGKCYYSVSDIIKMADSTETTVKRKLNGYPRKAAKVLGGDGRNRAGYVYSKATVEKVFGITVLASI